MKLFILLLSLFLFSPLSYSQDTERLVLTEEEELIREFIRPCMENENSDACQDIIDECDTEEREEEQDCETLFNALLGGGQPEDDLIVNNGDDGGCSLNPKTSTQSAFVYGFMMMIGLITIRFFRYSK